MSPTLKLASSAEDVKIWDYPDLNLAHQYNYRGSKSIESICWSPDYQQVVSVPSKSDTILVTLFKNSNFYNITHSIGQEISAACFSQKTARFIGIGSSSGKVLIWDQKSKNIKKNFASLNGKTTSLQFNYDDNYLASASETGLINLHNVTSGIKTATIDLSKEQQINNIMYSYTKKYFLGSVSSSGYVSIHDTNTNKQIYHADSHFAPATNLSFSPVNFYLLVTVGLDKKILFYDVLERKQMRTILCDEPLTSVDILEDGITLAAGSTQGKVYIYDLRNCSAPLNSMVAHNSAISGLTFQKSTVKGSEFKISEIKSESKHSNVDSLDLTLDDDVFSPVASGKDAPPENTFSSTFFNFDCKTNWLKKNNNDEIKDSKMACTPKVETLNFSAETIQKLKNLEKHEPPLIEPLKPSTSQRIPAGFLKETLVRNPAQPPQNEAVSQTDAAVSFSPPVVASYPVPSPAKPEEHVTNPEASNVQMSLIKQLVQDSVSEAYDKIHKEYVALHCEMIRQFQIQLGEVQSLLQQQFSREQQLEQQLRTLQEENSQLKASMKTIF